MPSARSYSINSIAKHLAEAVDLVRRREDRQLKASGDDRLAGTCYDWLRHPARMEPEDRKQFSELRDSSLKTARAWALKEAMMACFEYIYERPARKHSAGGTTGPCAAGCVRCWTKRGCSSDGSRTS
jgi:Transposase